jgi:predicted transcriptional regulator
MNSPARPASQRPIGNAASARSDDRALEVLEAVAEDSQLTQRGLATKLGIAVGLTNLYLRRLARKGYIKFVSVRPNRIMYLLTPKGIAEKSRLTYEFMDYSLFLYRQVRTHLNATVQECVHSSERVALYGTGEAAELAYLCLREHGLEPVAVFDKTHGQFLGMPVRDIRDHHSVAFDVLIVARLESVDELLAEITMSGVAPAKVVTLRPSHRTAGRAKPRRTQGSGVSPSRP